MHISFGPLAGECSLTNQPATAAPEKQVARQRARTARNLLQLTKPSETRKMAGRTVLTALNSLLPESLEILPELSIVCDSFPAKIAAMAFSACGSAEISPF